MDRIRVEADFGRLKGARSAPSAARERIFESRVRITGGKRVQVEAMISSPRMNDIPQTRQSLLLELGQRADDAWAEFLRVYETAIQRVCRARGLQEADANDVTQEVFAAVLERVPTWSADAARGSFRGWVLRVARNISVDVITRRLRADADGSQSDPFMHNVPDLSAESQSELDLEYRRSLFEWSAEKVRSEVREATWRAFELTALQGISAEDAAEQLEMQVGAVYTAKCRVMARIRERAATLQANFDFDDLQSLS